MQALNKGLISGRKGMASRVPRIANPYTGGTAYKFQGHMHSKNDPEAVNDIIAHPENADLWRTPAELAADYLALGYNAISISEHYSYTPDPEVEGLVYLTGVEMIESNDYQGEGLAGALPDLGGHGGHVLVYGVTEYPGATGNHMRNIGSLFAYALERDLLVGFAHPGDQSDITLNPTNAMIDAYMTSSAYQYITEVITSYDAENPDAYKWEEEWDYMLWNGSMARKVWALGADDFHMGGMGVTHNIVYAAAPLTTAKLLAAIQAGNIYASGGPTISSVSVAANIITLAVGAAATIEWKHQDGEVMQTDLAATSSVYVMTRGDRYIRAVVTADSNGRKAFTQPFWWNDN